MAEDKPENGKDAPDKKPEETPPTGARKKTVTIRGKEIDDRREYKRIPHAAQVEYRAIYPNAPKIKDWLDSRTVNVSGGGVCIKTNIKPREGDTLEIALTLGGKRYSLVGRVTWVDEDPDNDGNYNFGVQFVKITAAERQAIIKHVVAGVWHTRTEEEEPTADNG